MAIGTSQWLADQLVRSIKRRAFLPLADESYSSADVLEVINEEIADYMLEFLLNVDEELLLRNYDVAVTAASTSVRLPPRCAGEAFHSVHMLVTGDTVFRPITRLDPAKASKLGKGYVLEDDLLTLWQPDAGTLRVKYFARPNQVVLAASALQLTAVNTGTGLCTAAAATGALLSTTLACDVVAGTPGFRSRGIDLTADTQSATPNITITGIPSDTVVGDWLCVAGQAPFAQLPADALPLLAQRCAVKMLEGKGGANYTTAAAELANARARAAALLRPRGKAAPKYVHNFNSVAWRVRSLRGVPR